jgi:hypothetical protein
MMECEFSRQNSLNTDDRIDDYLSGRLSQKEAETFELHYLSCDDCFRKLQARKQMLAVIREKGETLFAEFIEEEANKGSKNGIRPRQFADTLRDIGERKIFWIYISGTAAVLLILILYFAKERHKPPLAESFRESPYLEERIKTQDFRRSGNGFQLIAPAGEADFSPQTPILFRWEKSGTEPLRLKILNNKGDKLFSFPVSENQYLFREELPPGLYYWKVETDDDFRIGKFFVEKP